MKPMACRLWAIKISDKPRYGKPNDAVYNYGGRRLFVYVEPSCPGLRWGKPGEEFARATLGEFVNLALGQCKRQFYSTSRLLMSQQWKLI